MRFHRNFLSLIIILLTISFSTFTLSSCRAQTFMPQQLTLKKQKGLDYNVSISEHVNYKADTVSSNVKSKTTFLTSLIPERINKDSIMFNAKFKEIRAKVQGLPGEQQTIDTVLKINNNPKNDIHFAVSSRGDFTGLKDYNYYEQSSPYLPYFVQFLSGVFIELPARQIKLNESWNAIRVDTIRQGLSKLIINMPVNYTYLGNKDTLGYNCAEITFNSTAFDISLQDELMKIFNIQYTLEGEGMIKGRMLVDLKSGRTVNLSQESLTSYTLGIITPNQVKNIIPVKTTQYLRAYLE